MGERDGQCSEGDERARTATRRTVLRSAGVGVGGLALGGFSGSAAAAPSRLHTDGKWIKDADGDRFKPRGHAIADPGYYERYHPKSSMAVAKWATDGERGWHPNLLRIPCTQDSIAHYGAATYVQEYVRPIVDLCADRGIYAMVDLHLVRPYTEQATDDAATDYAKYPDEVVRAFWNEAAPAFADDTHVLFELFNEPTEPAYWGDDQRAWREWKNAAQPWVDRVRELAPETPIVVGSPRWTSLPDAAPGDPFAGDNLIYAGHIYPANGQPSEFDSTYGAPAEDVPVFITEFGWDPDGDPDVDEGTTSGWGEPFREWVEGYENVGWAAWCFDDSWAPTFFDSPGAGAAEPWTLKDGDEQAGGFVETWLEETVGTDTTAPTAPANLSVPATTETTVDLSWDASSDSGGSGLDHYAVSCDGCLDRTVPAGTTEATVSGLTPGRSYDVSVTAVDGAGNESTASDTSAVTTDTRSRGSVDLSEGTYRIRNVNSGLAMDVEGIQTDDGADVRQWPDTGADEQTWRVTRRADSTYTFEAVHSGKVLDVAGWVTRDGANVHQWSETGGDNQRFELVDEGDGEYRIEPVHSGKAVAVADCSTAEGATVEQQSWTGDPGQRWTFTPV